MVALANGDPDARADSYSVTVNPRLPIALPLLLAACSTPSTQTPVIEAPPQASFPSTEEPAPAAPEPTVPPPRATLAEFTLPEAGPNPVSAWRPPPYEVPLALRPEDHFYFARPIPSGDVNWPNPRYRYGSTAFGEETVHTGVDLGADRNTEVRAAADGEVIWVGYGLYRGLYDPNDPYGLAIAIRHDFGYRDQLLYTVYAHLSSTVIWLGQRVSAGERIGTVGSTGHASGPHLHFEVRVGENRYFATRNPELWMVPAEGWGVLAGKVENSFGNPLTEHSVQIKSVETEQTWEVWTYALGTVNADEHYQENFVISDLPAGPYQVKVNFLGRSYGAFLFVYAGQTNRIAFHGRHGLAVETMAASPRTASPPFP